MTLTNINTDILLSLAVINLVWNLTGKKQDFLILQKEKGGAGRRREMEEKKEKEKEGEEGREQRKKCSTV